MKKILFSLVLITLHTIGFAQTERRGETAERSSTRSSSPSFSPNQNFRNNLNRTVPDNTRQNIPQQNALNSWNQLDTQERHNMVKNMNPKERSQFMQNIKQDIFLDELNIPKSSQVAFTELFQQYNDSQKAIKEQFKGTVEISKLSDEEAKRKLDESFTVGKQLLDNRQEYANKFLQILSPQQVLKLFQTEGKVRDKIMDKKYGGK